MYLKERFICLIGIVIGTFMIYQFNIHENICKTEVQQTTQYKNNNHSDPLIYFVTPTYHRMTQLPDMTRLSQTLRYVSNLLWIVIEDSEKPTEAISELLFRYNRSHIHLTVKTPNNPKEKGLPQRNAALDWIRQTHKPGIDRGIVFFGDDDNSYDWQLFSELRKTIRVSIFPVGLSGGKAPGEKPLLKDGKVVGFYAWASNSRKFATDMAGFAFNADILFEVPSLKFRHVHRGFLETDFLEQFTKLEDLEPLASNCTKFYVWHTRTSM